MQLLSLHINDVSDSPRFFFSKDCSHGQLGGLPVNVEHVPQLCAYTHPIGHVHLVQRISTLGIEGREDRWSGDSAPGATNERRRHLTAIREFAR